MKSRLESQIDAELAQIGVKKAHIAHLKHPDGMYYKVMTVATSRYVTYPTLSVALSACYLKARVDKRSDFGTLLIDEFSRYEAGVALCHHLDNFNRELGRTIAKGRLLKLLQPQQQENEAEEEVL